MPLIILDRDGVINEDSDAYIKSPDEWHPIPGSLEAIAALNHQGCPVAIATNQSGIGRGYYTEATLNDMHKKMQRLLAKIGGRISHIEFCPHLPDDGCDCRKPRPGMLLKVLENMEHSASDTWFVGDNFKDVQAGRAAGCHTALVLTGKGRNQAKKYADQLTGVPVFNSLSDFADALIHGRLQD
jgi:D-glycero-D-manno-heptose 1,7-bisphosphate phosphatase